jgi:hypothetical protein
LTEFTFQVAIRTDRTVLFAWLAMLFAIEILLAGTAAVWLLGLLPALTVTVLKGNSRLLGWGFLTFGLTWFGGALALAPADSPWAQRRYDSETLARSGAPLSAQRSPRVLGLWTLAGLVSVVLAGAFIARPAPVLGIDGSALESSMPRTPLSAPPCEQVAGGYRCWVEPAERSGGATPYRVELRGRGCWTARPLGPIAPEGRGTISGCVTLLDYL